MSYRVSSNMTFLLRVMVPTIWTTFFGLFAIAFFVADPEQLPLLYNPVIKWSFLAAYLLFLVFLRFTIMRLLRVEYDDEYVYATNYFKTVRYPWSSVETIKSYNLGFTQLISVHLKEKGKFGRKIRYLAAKSRLKSLMETSSVINKQHNSYL